MTDENQTPDQVTPFAVDEEEDEQEEVTKRAPPIMAMYATSVNLILGEVALLQGATNQMAVLTDPDEGSIPGVDNYYGDDPNDLEDLDPEADTRVVLSLEALEGAARLAQTMCKKIADRAATLRSTIEHRPKPIK